MSANGTAPLHCPSAQPGMADLQVLGVVMRDADEALRVAYLNTHLPVTPEILASTAPLPATSVMRLAGRCEEGKCTHFDGESCQLATRIAHMLDAVVDALPPCVIRPTCRWHAQEGRDACLRCPQVVTESTSPDERLRALAHTATARENEAPS